MSVPDPATVDWVPLGSAPAAAIPPTIVDAAGDLIVASAADTVQRLAKGSDGQVLTAQAAAPGVGWATPAAGGGGAAPGYGTTLPASPTDGQEYILVDSVTNPSYQWRFRYNAGSASPHKWEFVGGTMLSAIVTTTESRNATTYGDLATVGPQVTVPRAGEYQIELWSHAHGGGSTLVQPWIAAKLGAAATSDADGLLISYTGNEDSRTQIWTRRTLAASDVVKMQYRSEATAAAAAWWERRLAVTPLRIS